MRRWLRYGHRGETTLRVVIAVALFSGLLSLATLSRNTSAAATTVTRSVANSADDARQSDVPGYSSTERTALVGTGSGTLTNVNGFRFTNVTISQGAKITSVEFSMVKATTQSGRLVVTLGFEASGNAAAFSAANAPDDRTMTNARYGRNDNLKRTNGARYTLASGSQLVASLQEVVNRPDWQSGNSVALLAWGASNPAWARMSFYTRDSGPSSAPMLKVIYETAGTNPIQPTETPTNTSVPPTATPTDTPAPPTATSTDTPVPPTATSTTTTPPAAYAQGVPWSSQPSWTQPAGAATPVAGQPCPVWVHDRYAAQGPDGRWYPTWHPSVDPQYSCAFGHEHGDNPNGSPALQGHPVLFGYASLDAGMNEGHVGFKVFRWDNIHHYNAPAHEGASVVMTLHQGTAGAGRFTIYYHSIQVDYANPNDGRVVHVMMLAPFGKLLVGCGANDPAMLLSLQQANIPGARQLSADKCFNSPNIPYEDWITALYVGTDSQGNWKAYMDPHFAIFNPNTYCIVQNGACTIGYSDQRAGTGADPASSASWFKGDKREAYLNQVWIDNQGGSSSIWTDPYGKLVAAGTPGAIQQYIATLDSRPLTNSAAFGEDHIHDPDGSVHAPN